jgi:hypothetical protein
VTAGEGSVAVHRLAPWARRRGRIVQLVLIGGSLVLAAAFLATLSGTDSFTVGVVLAVATVGVGAGMALYLGRTVPRVRLEIGASGVVYDAGNHRIEASWPDVAAIDLIIRGSDTGPALVLVADRAVGGGGMLHLADVGGAIGGTGLGAPSMRSTIPLAGFLQDGLAGSPVADDLRRFIPMHVDAYLVRYPDRGRRR